MRASRAVEWLDERLPFLDAIKAARDRRVPDYATAFHRYLGGLAVILLGIEGLTGLLLTVYYVPDGAGDPAPAFSSVSAIQDSVPLGWLVRGMHFWGASALLVVVLLHMIAVLWTGGYRAPREVNWTVGAILLLLVVAFSLTGSLLPWNVNAYLARATEIKYRRRRGSVSGAAQRADQVLAPVGTGDRSGNTAPLLCRPRDPAAGAGGWAVLSPSEAGPPPRAG